MIHITSKGLTIPDLSAANIDGGNSAWAYGEKLENHCNTHTFCMAPAEWEIPPSAFPDI